MVKTYLRNNCRICKSRKLEVYVDLGKMPHAGDFLEKEDIGKEKYYDLRIFKCKKCGLIQVLDVINPDLLFKNYKYSSSVGLGVYFNGFAKYLVSKKLLKQNQFAVEIGSNDGVFLMPLKSLGVKTLGVEPSVNIAKASINNGIDTLNNYFNNKTAAKILKNYGPADMITASNVMAHIDDLDEVLSGIKKLLKPDGFFVMEAHYIYRLIADVQFDFFYNEHLCYFGVRDLARLFNMYEMEIFDVKKTGLHGGTIRVFVKHKSSKKWRMSHSVNKFIDMENSGRFQRLMADFPKKVSARINRIKMIVNKITKDGGNIAGLGASGRANTIINLAGLSNKDILYIADESPLRIGKYLPGSHIPVKSLNDFLNDRRITHCILFAWAYKKQILPKILTFTRRAGKIIKP